MIKKYFDILDRLEVTHDRDRRIHVDGQMDVRPIHYHNKCPA